MKDWACTDSYSLDRIPFAAAPSQATLLAGDWSVGPIEAIAEAHGLELPLAVVWYLCLRSRPRFTGVGLIDFEGEDSSCFKHYPAIIQAIRAAWPRMTVAVWTSNAAYSTWSDHHRAICESASAVAQHVYPMWHQSPMALMRTTTTLLEETARNLPGKPLLPCLSSEYGWMHPRWGRVLTAAEWLATRMGVSVAQNFPGANIIGTVTWGAAQDADRAKRQAMIDLGLELRDAAKRLRRFETQWPDVPVGTAEGDSDAPAGFEIPMTRPPGSFGRKETTAGEGAGT